MQQQYTSSFKRLSQLPELFRGADLTVRFSWTSKTASQYLYLWKASGYVSALGGHSDIYANRIALGHRSPPWEKALLMAMPSSMIAGLEALRCAGWITQIPALPTVVVDGSCPVYSTPHFSIVQKPTGWFKKTRPHIETAVDRLPVLWPAWALADLLATHGWGNCGVWPDDIEWDLIDDRQEHHWANACKAFGIAVHALRSWESDSRSCEAGRSLVLPECSAPTAMEQPTSSRTSLDFG